MDVIYWAGLSLRVCSSDESFLQPECVTFVNASLTRFRGRDVDSSPLIGAALSSHGVTAERPCAL